MRLLQKYRRYGSFVSLEPHGAAAIFGCDPIFDSLVKSPISALRFLRICRIDLEHLRTFRNSGFLRKCQNLWADSLKKKTIREI